MGKKAKKKNLVCNTVGDWVNSAINERLAEFEDKGIEIQSVSVMPSTNTNVTENGYEVWFKIIFDKNTPSAN